MATEAEFQAASVRIKTLTSPPDNMALLNLYALYKQAKQGDAAGKRPGALSMVKRAKFDAWFALKGTSPETARFQYVALVGQLMA
jgi:acyl-CoA-binding protein